MLKIYVTPMSYRIHVDPSAWLLDEHGNYLKPHYNIEKYVKKFDDERWDSRLRRFIRMRRYLYYDKNNKLLHLPRFDLFQFEVFLHDRHIPFQEINLELVQGKEVDIPLNPIYQDKDQDQTDAINSLVYSEHHVRGLALQTGKGKTYSAIRAMASIGRRSMITVNGLTGQWIDAIKQFTLLEDDDIFLMQGADSVAKILSRIDRNLFPKIIVASSGTLRPYCFGKPNYVNYPSFDEICRLLNVGVRVVDEAHLEFFLNFILDLRWNTNININLTATFGRSDRVGQKIYNQHYPTTIRHGEEKYTKYVNVYAYGYRTGYGVIPAKAYSGQNGYSHAKYESYLLLHRPRLNQIYTQNYKPVFDGHYINIKRPGQKLLVLCSTTNMCTWMTKQLRQDYPDLKTELYLFGSDDSVLADNDIIVSTEKSAGTGTDIKNLRTMVNTISIASAILNKQILGRLRQLPNGDTPEFINVFNKDITPHVNHAQARRDLYTGLALNFTEVDI